MHLEDVANVTPSRNVTPFHKRVSHAIVSHLHSPPSAGLQCSKNSNYLQFYSYKRLSIKETKLVPGERDTHARCPR